MRVWGWPISAVRWRSQRRKSKLIIACIGAGVLVAVFFAAVGFFFTSGERDYDGRTSPLRNPDSQAPVVPILGFQQIAGFMASESLIHEDTLGFRLGHGVRIRP